MGVLVAVTDHARGSLYVRDLSCSSAGARSAGERSS
jgi:hypothetical protein